MKTTARHRKLLVSLDQRHTARQQISSGILRWSMNHANWDVEFACEPLGGRELRDYLDWGADALIIDDSHLQLSDRELVKISGGHLVFANCRERQIKGLDYAILESDDLAIGKRAATLMLRNGLRQFAFLPWSVPTRWSDNRGRNFAKLIRDRKYPITTIDQLNPETLRALPKPCGIFCANDIRARQAIIECRRAGIKVPQEIQVVGIDDNQLICNNVNPPITSVLPDFSRGGFLAANWVSKRIDKPAATPKKAPILVFPCLAVKERLSTTGV